MRYRKLTDTNDYSFGHGEADFYKDVPEAPAQAVLTRLMLFRGQWFLDKTAGTPWNTQVLGKYTLSSRDPVIRARVLDTAEVTEIQAYYSVYNPNTRQFTVGMRITTSYGEISISGAR